MVVQLQRAEAMPKLSIPLLLLLGALAVAPAPAQDSDAQQRFAGVWEAKFKSRVICTIKLEMGENISGSMQNCKISVNADGDLIDPETSESSGDESDPILNPAIQGDTLAFEIKDEDDVLKLEMQVTAEGRAELRFLNPPAPIKPIHFERTE